MKRVSSTHEHSMCVQPTFLIGTYNEDGTPNFCPITWISVTYDGQQYLLVASMSGAKWTKANIARTGVFSANLASTDMLQFVDYFGSRSGKSNAKNDVAFDFADGAVLHVPTLDLSRWVYECEVADSLEKSGTTTYFCKMRNVQVMEELQGVDELFNIDLTKLEPIVYSGMYHSIGKNLGNIGDYLSTKK